ncbi:MAG TPA: hypothetical protein VGC91_06940 [Pyrinomonadaceae bacterium]|jgi:hypothetical protein
MKVKKTFKLTRRLRDSMIGDPLKSKNLSTAVSVDYQIPMMVAHQFERSLRGESGFQHRQYPEVGRRTYRSQPVMGDNDNSMNHFDAGLPGREQFSRFIPPHFSGDETSSENLPKSMIFIRRAEAGVRLRFI